MGYEGWLPVEKTERVTGFDEGFISDNEHRYFDPVIGIGDPDLFHYPLIWFEPIHNDFAPNGQSAI